MISVEKTGCVASECSLFFVFHSPSSKEREMGLYGAHEGFFSKITNTWWRAFNYTPPGYDIHLW
jgi:hypothetical protein